MGLTATDTLKNGQKVKKPIYHLTGINGDQHKVKTGGHLMGNFITDDEMKWLTQIHLIDRQLTGKYDGYVGYDFLKRYKAKLDIHNKVLELHKPIDSDCLSAQQKPATKEQLEAKVEKLKSPNSPKSKKVGFAIPESIQTVNNFVIEEIPIAKCQINGHCDTCEANKANLPKTWQSAQLGDIAIKTINSSVESMGTVNMLNEYNKLKINDYDTEVIKLKKLEKNNLVLPPHAVLYIKTFPMEFHDLPVRKIRKIDIQPGMSREDIIRANLPMDHCSDENRAKIYDLVTNFPNQFYVEGDMLGKTDIIQHKIYLKPGTPILYTRQFRLSETMRKDVIKETREMEEQGVLAHSVSPFNSPAFMVSKKDEMGGYLDQRLVMNFIKVNEHTELRDFPIPRIDQLVDNFSQCKYFSTVDIKSAYHQIELYEPHREITAFTAGFTKYEWNRMPEGLCGAPLTMQEAVTRLLRNEK